MAIPGIDTGVTGALGLLTARHAGASFTVGGIDVLLGAASQAVLGFAWTDNTSDQADDLIIQIADPQRTWMQTYLPTKGVECSGEIKVYNWSTLGDTRKLDCGSFWVDQIDFSGPPNVVNISAVSVPINTGIKNEKHWYGWEGVDILTIAEEVASKNGLMVVWDVKDVPEKQTRVDQVGSPDLEFLREKLKEKSLSLKVYKKQLVIYSEEEYEARGAVFTLTYGMSNIIAYSFHSKLDDTYKKVHNAYVSPPSGELIDVEFEPTDPPEGTESVLEENEEEQEEPQGGITIDPSPPPGLRAEGDFIDYKRDPATADVGKAKSKLREKNKKEKTCEMIVVGNPDYLSGLNVEIVGFGIFDGKWFIYSTSHEISAEGYITTLYMRYCLNGY